MMSQDKQLRSKFFKPKSPQTQKNVSLQIIKYELGIQYEGKSRKTML